jgi:hypothetical protein
VLLDMVGALFFQIAIAIVLRLFWTDKLGGEKGS